MKPGPPGHVRIIAGHLRGSKLPVADRPGLRPTSDRVRETVFNWLQPMLPGARVLDLFAGTGALGFEAASRGAARVLLVERDPQLAASLRDQAARLKADTVQVVHADALAWLRDAPDEEFDGVFLDPPFDAALWDAAAALLPPRLAPSAWVYVETPAGSAPSLPPGWVPHRAGKTRDVGYALFRTSAGPAGGSAATLPGDLPPQGEIPE
jgi:16S rRNA (guanine966-N2)-methyltransferase